MFARLINKLRSGLGADTPEPGLLVLLNYNSVDPSRPGDVELYRSLEALAGDMQPEDVATGGYRAVCSQGRLVTLRVMEGSVVAELASVPSAQGLARDFLRHHLLQLIEISPTLFSVDRSAIARETDMTRLIALIPAKVVSR